VGDETAVSAGRAAARLPGLVPGRDRKIYGHVLIYSRISPDAKAKAEDYYFPRIPSGQRLCRQVTQLWRMDDQRPQRGARCLLPLRRGQAPSAVRRANQPVSSSTRLFSERFKHDKDCHGRLIARVVRHHERVPVDRRVVGGALRPQRRRKVRAHDQRRRHYRVSLCSPGGVYKPCARSARRRPRGRCRRDRTAGGGRGLVDARCERRYGHSRSYLIVFRHTRAYTPGIWLCLGCIPDIGRYATDTRGI
jgi:hypothetical protein